MLSGGAKAVLTEAYESCTGAFGHFELALYAVLFFYMVDPHNGYLDCFVLLLMAIAITISFSGAAYGSKCFNIKLCFFLGKWAMPLFLGHTYIAQNLNYVLPKDFSDTQRMLVYLTCAGLVSFAIWGISALILKSLPRWRTAVKNALIAQ